MSITGSCDACHVASGHAPWCMYARPEHKSADHAAADISSRLDAALKRIGELEQVVVGCITRIEELERR